MGIPLREGRLLESADSHSENRACVVDEDFARTYWPKGNAIGQRVFTGTSEGKSPSEAYAVVGVVAAVKQKELMDAKAGRAIYFPYRYEAANKIFVVTRTSLAPESFGLTVQKAVRQIDPELPIYDLRSMEVRIADSLVGRRSPALLTGIFAGVALLLAALGTYGVLLPDPNGVASYQLRGCEERATLGHPPRRSGTLKAVPSQHSGRVEQFDFGSP